MDDLLNAFRNLRRPRLLLQAARAGLASYRRERDLARICHMAGRDDLRVAHLLAAENGLEEARRKGDASYSVTRHLELMIALMAEVLFLQKRRIA